MIALIDAADFAVACARLSLAAGGRVYSPSARGTIRVIATSSPVRVSG